MRYNSVQHTVDVLYFCENHLRAILPAKDCLLYSKQCPSVIIGGHKSAFSKAIKVRLLGFDWIFPVNKLLSRWFSWWKSHWFPTFVLNLFLSIDFDKNEHFDKKANIFLFFHCATGSRRVYPKCDQEIWLIQLCRCDYTVTVQPIGTSSLRHNSECVERTGPHSCAGPDSKTNASIGHSCPSNVDASTTNEE